MDFASMLICAFVSNINIEMVHLNCLTQAIAFLKLSRASCKFEQGIVDSVEHYLQYLE